MNRIDSEYIIIVPCFNEGQRLDKEAFLSYCKGHPNFSFLFVNDGSTDKTEDLLIDISNQSEQCHYISAKENKGKAEGIRWAINELQNSSSTFNYVGYLDADLSTPLSEFTLFTEAINNNNNLLFLMGSRFLRINSNITRNWYRHYPGRVFATIVSTMLKLPVYDTQCGVKLIHQSVADELFKQAFITKWIFDVELIFRLKSIKDPKQVMIEIPLNTWTEMGGSKIRFLDFLRAPLDLLKIYMQYK